MIKLQMFAPSFSMKKNLGWPKCQHGKLVGGFSPNPSEKYAKIKLGSSSPNFGVKMKS